MNDNLTYPNDDLNDRKVHGAGFDKPLLLWLAEELPVQREHERHRTNWRSCEVMLGVSDDLEGRGGK